MPGRTRDNGGAAARSARARTLHADASPAADLLGFYAALVDYQQRLADERGVGRVLSDPPGAGAKRPRPTSSDSLLGGVDPQWVSQAVHDFVVWLPQVASPGLRAAVEPLQPVTGEEWRELFEAYRANPDEAAARFDGAAVFALEAVLQPIAERLAAARPPHSARDAARSRCPICGGAPVVGVLREAGHGARRRLVCGLCCTEWDYLRVVCVKCGEQRFDALPVFTAEQFPHARVDACDTCRSYLKTIDATRDGRVVPVVDDLATVALDLWARDQGYARVRANLIRI